MLKITRVNFMHPSKKVNQIGFGFFENGMWKIRTHGGEILRLLESEINKTFESFYRTVLYTNQLFN